MRHLVSHIVAHGDTLRPTVSAMIGTHHYHKYSKTSLPKRWIMSDSILDGMLLHTAYLLLVDYQDSTVWTAEKWQYEFCMDTRRIWFFRCKSVKITTYFNLKWAYWVVKGRNSQIRFYYDLIIHLRPLVVINLFSSISTSNLPILLHRVGDYIIFLIPTENEFFRFLNSFHSQRAFSCGYSRRRYCRNSSIS